jgi:putative hydrolase of HD superfamily
VQSSLFYYHKSITRLYSAMKKKTDGKESKKIASFLYEIGHLRKVARSHRQTLLEDDMSDNIASHSYRVTIIAWFLAKLEGADPYKTVMMSLFHDTAEVRTNDHNWLHKRYVKVFVDEAQQEQLKPLPFGNELFKLVHEYEKRESLEAKLAKDADLLDQVLLLREYEHKGNKEAALWLKSSKERRYFSKHTLQLIDELFKQDPGDWWKMLATNINRK